MANREFNPPIQGINKGFPADKVMPGTSEYMNNVRAKGWNGRILIVQRPALDRWGLPTQVGDTEQPVVAMCTVSAVV